MKTSSIYSSGGRICYQYGASRTVCEEGSIPVFEVLKSGVWVAGRNRFALSTMEKVRKELYPAADEEF